MVASKTRTNGHTRPIVGIDELTGVWNRAGFVAAATPMFVSCQRREAPIALAYFDFKSANTTRSAAENAAIDQVMLAMAGQIRAAFRGSDIIGRVDTFRIAVLLADCTEAALAAVEGVRALTDEATSPFGLTLSAGMVRSSPGGTLDQLMLDADVRMKELERD